MTNNKQQTEMNAVEYLDKVNQFAKENNTDKPRQQTAVELFWNQLPEILPFTVDTQTAIKLLEAYQKAKEIEKRQIVDAWSNGFDEDDRATSNPFKYYNEIYGGCEQ